MMMSTLLLVWVVLGQSGGPFGEDQGVSGYRLDLGSCEADGQYLVLRERYFGGRATVSYPVVQSVHVSVEIEVERRSSSLSVFDYERNSIGFGVSVIF